MWATLGALLALAAASGGSRAEETCAGEPGPTGAVVRVLDAETIALDDGSEVRLVGALAPRSPAAADWPPERAARAALEGLVLGRAVTLRYAGRRSDRYGRRLAHVFVASGGERLWVQGELLSRGHARAYALPGSTACLAEMLARERAAREAGLGLWTNAAYRVRRAEATEDLLARRASFEIVEGTVEDVAERTSRTYLNFGRDWRRDFTAAVPRDVLQASPDAGPRLRALKGQRVRVRGWIERRNGPLIEVASLDEIEPLDATSAGPD